MRTVLLAIPREYCHYLADTDGAQATMWQFPWPKRQRPLTGVYTGKRRKRRRRDAAADSRMRVVAARLLRAMVTVWLISVYAGVLIGMALLGATLHPLRLSANRAPGPTVIYTSDGKPLARLYEQYRVPVRIDQVPLSTIRAVLAAEDRRFFAHHGLDGRGIVRAAWVNLRAGRIVQGGSTITQQLVRLERLDGRRTWRRKLLEVVLALRVERGMTKREILERYLNTVYFGGGAYGIGAAAESYFRKPVERLSPAEGALLAGLIRAPGSGDPRYSPEVASRRQAAVLAAMRRLGWLSRRDYEAARNARVVIRPRVRHPWRAAYVVEAVRQELMQAYGRDLVYHGGLEVYTTINGTMQAAAEGAMARALRDGRGRGVGNGALVAIDPANGEIRALVGGASFRASQFNRALQARRQPGSAFKAFVYLAAIEQGILLTDLADDAPITIGSWTPENYGNRYHGRVTLETALARSLNSVAVRVARQVGPQAVIAAARQAGITSPLQPSLVIALGAYEVTPLEMAVAFATLAHGGRATQPGLLREVRRGDEVLFRRQPVARQRITPVDAFLLTQGLRQVITRGTGRRAAIGRPAAGKTGTSNSFHDAWFVGYTPDLAAAVWLGRDNQQPMRGVAGGSLPAQAWAQFMRAALKGMLPRDFPVPAGVEEVTLCAESGQAATPWCPSTLRRYLPIGRVPQSCALHTTPSPPPSPPPDTFAPPPEELPPDVIVTPGPGSGVTPEATGEEEDAASEPVPAPPIDAPPASDPVITDEADPGDEAAPADEVDPGDGMTPADEGVPAEPEEVPNSEPGPAEMVPPEEGAPASPGTESPEATLPVVPEVREERLSSGWFEAIRRWLRSWLPWRHA